jgi:hypothetical protein
MDNYKVCRGLDWTAGRHWREAMALGGFVSPSHDPERATAYATQALFHLAAAQLLLDHNPTPFAHLYSGDSGASEDWRQG